jgi:hypothetical protein
MERCVLENIEIPWGYSCNITDGDIIRTTMGITSSAAVSEGIAMM